MQYFKCLKSNLDPKPFLDEIKSIDGAWAQSTDRQDKTEVQRFVSGGLDRIVVLDDDNTSSPKTPSMRDGRVDPTSNPTVLCCLRSPQ